MENPNDCLAKTQNKLTWKLTSHAHDRMSEKSSKTRSVCEEYTLWVIVCKNEQTLILAFVEIINVELSSLGTAQMKQLPW